MRDHVGVKSSLVVEFRVANLALVVFDLQMNAERNSSVEVTDGALRNSNLTV